ncbi:MAG TPA: hypothetical protein VF832_04085 [Longimicrobiales bacterium]
MMEHHAETSWRAFLTTLAGGMAAIALYAGLLAVGFSRMAHVAQHFG